MYMLSIRLDDEVEMVGYTSRGRMVAEATEYAEKGYIVGWKES